MLICVIIFVVVVVGCDVVVFFGGGNVGGLNFVLGSGFGVSGIVMLLFGG